MKDYFGMKLSVIGLIGAVLIIGLAGCKYFDAAKNMPQSIGRDYSDFFGDSKASVVFYRSERNEYIVYNKAGANIRHSPCSTFKIVSTLMGLDAGAVASADTRLGYDGAKYEYTAWNKDVTLEEAFRASCVWYYKKLTAKLEKPYVQETLNRLHYGNCDISVWNNSGHNAFWLVSTLQISPLEQTKVLRAIFSGKSGFKPEHVAILKNCMKYDNIGAIGFYGKTGTGRNHNTNHLEGWFVGFLALSDGELVYYAVHMADPDKDISGPMVRGIVEKIVKQTFPEKHRN